VSYLLDTNTVVAAAQHTTPGAGTVPAGPSVRGRPRALIRGPGVALSEQDRYDAFLGRLEEEGETGSPARWGEAKGGQGFSVVPAEPVHMTKNRRCWHRINPPRVSGRFEDMVHDL